MGATDDDVLPITRSYPYIWDSTSELTLADFLKKYKPSMVQNDGTKPWLWVGKSDSNGEERLEEAAEEAKTLLEEVTEKVESIKNDESIPVRANKKKGLKSKKELREEIQAEAAESLKAISVRHGCVSGKWLIFAPQDKVDLIWSTLATSLIEGPLKPTCAYLTKVSTCPKEETPNYQHVMCLYMPDVYDRNKVTEVMKILLRNHGMNLMGVKSNLYTAIGLDSKHPSGVQSTVWKNSALMKETEIKALKDEFYAEINTAKVANTAKATEKVTTVKASSEANTKPKLQKKAVQNDIFASDSEEEKTSAEKLPPKTVGDAKGKSKAPIPKKKPAQEYASDAEDDSEIEARKRDLQAKKAGSKVSEKKRAKTETDEDTEDARPRKAVKKSRRK